MNKIIKVELRFKWVEMSIKISIRALTMFVFYFVSAYVAQSKNPEKTASKNHKLETVYFISPILCIFCKLKFNLKEFKFLCFLLFVTTNGIIKFCR